jgi:hypothetical protein
MKQLLTILLSFISLVGFSQATPISDGYLNNIGDGMIGGVGATRTIDAADYGFLPGASAAANVAAWNSMPGGATINICTAGTYEINGTLFTKSNTTYNFCTGITVKKFTGTGFCQIFENDYAITGIRNSNIKLKGTHTRLMVNGNESTTTNLIPGAFAQVSFYKADGIEFDGFYCNDLGISQYFFLGSDVTDMIIKNASVSGTKDGFDFIGLVDGVTMDSVNTKTVDDGIFFGPSGYPDNTPTIGYVKNITITNWTDSTITSQGGFALRLNAFSWRRWISSSVYQRGDIVTNGGRIYHKMNVGKLTASVAPTHTSGTVTGADNIQWRYVRDGSDSTANCTNVTIKDSKIASSRTFLNLSMAVDTGYWRGFYPGTYGNAIMDNIVMDNVTFSGNAANARRIYAKGNVGRLTLKNGTYTAVSGTYFFQSDKTYSDSRIQKFLIDNCVFNFNAAQSLIYSTGTGFTFTSDTLAITNSSFTGAGDGSTNGLIGMYGAVDWQKIQLDHSTFTSVERLITHSTTNHNAITASYCTFTTPRYLEANTSTNSVISFTADHCTFGEPGQFLFFNNQSTSTMLINTTNSTETVSTAKRYSGGYVTFGVFDIN